MTNTAVKSKLDVMIAELAQDLREHVAKIEKKPATTQNHYGDYLGLIGSIANGNKNVAKIVVSALLEAGANHTGVAAAYKIMVG